MTTDRSARIQTMFSRIARRYDVMNRVMTLGRDQAWRRLAARALQLPPNALCLDLATGTGDLALAVREACPTARVVGMDFAFNMMQVGQQKLRARAHQKVVAGVELLPHQTGTTVGADVETLHATSLRLPQPIVFAQGDALALPFADATFDGLVNGFLLRNVVDLPRALAEMRRVVKPGGRVVSLEITRPRTPVFRQFFQLYFYRVVPLIGGLVAGDLQAYTYLPNSLTHFPDAAQLKAMMLTAGYQSVTVRLLSLGAMALHVAVV